MELFNRRAGAERAGVVPASMIMSLPDYGRAVIADKRSHAPVTDPRFGWDWLSQAILAMNGPQRDQVIQELYDAAVSAFGVQGVAEIDLVARTTTMTQSPLKLSFLT